MGRKVTCACGACAKCRNRIYVARSRRRVKPQAHQKPGAWMNRLAARPSAAPVAWDRMLSEIRRASGAGAVVRVHDGGRVTLDELGQAPRTWPSLESCLDALTAPSGM